jgi:hypothetical protein
LKSIKSEVSNTFVNTRGINFRGGLETNQFFDHSFESQGRFDTHNDMPNQLNQREAIPIIPELNCKILKLLHMISLAEANFYPQIHRFTVGLR